MPARQPSPCTGPVRMTIFAGPGVSGGGANLEVRHEHHVAGGVEVVADGLCKDGAQHGTRPGPLIAVPVENYCLLKYCLYTISLGLFLGNLCIPVSVYLR